MFWPSQRQRESAVNHYWNSVVEGAPSAPAGLDRGLGGLIDAVSASDSSPKPEQAFVNRLEAHLTSQAVWKSPAPQPAYLPGAENVSSSCSVPDDSRRFRLPDAGERSRLRAGLGWFTAQAAFVVLLIIIAGGIASIYLLGSDGEDGEREIPAVVDLTHQATPTAGNVVLPLAGAEFDPESIAPGGAESWFTASFLFVELRPGQANLMSICPGCQSMAIILVMEGQLTIDINGPVLRVAESWATIEPEQTEGEQLIQLGAGDAAIFNVQHVVGVEGIINTSNVDSQLLIGGLPGDDCFPMFAVSPRLFTNAYPLPQMTGGSIGVFIEEIEIRPGSRFAFEVSAGRTELYLFSSGTLTAVTDDGKAPGNRLTSFWRAPTGIQVDRYPPGAYFFQNDAPEPARLYRMSLTYPIVSDSATPESC